MKTINLKEYTNVGSLYVSKELLKFVNNEVLEGTKITPKNFWGGFEIDIQYWEFWQGRRNRTHDRFCYTQNNSGWDIERMSP